MSIKKIFDQQQKPYASSFSRGTAAMIDMWLVLLLRIVAMQFLGLIWFNKLINDFMTEFQNHFGTETIKNTQSHIDFVVHHRVFLYSLIFYAIVILLGALYHALLNSSSWQATIGKRLMGIMIIAKEGEQRISFNRGLSHYFLSILPFAFIFYLLAYQMRHKLNFFQTVTASETNVFLGIIFVFWAQIHLFTKDKTTAFDFICRTVLVNGKSAAKWPWSKSNSN